MARAVNSPATRGTWRAVESPPLKDQTLAVNAREGVYELRMSLSSPGLGRLSCRPPRLRTGMRWGAGQGLARPTGVRLMAQSRELGLPCVHISFTEPVFILAEARTLSMLPAQNIKEN